MTFTGVGLSVEVTSSGAWTRLQADGADYAVASDGVADVVLLTAFNKGANSVVVEFAISPDDTISDSELVGQATTLATGELGVDEGPYVANGSKRIYVRATGTTPEVILRGTLKGRT